MLPKAFIIMLYFEAPFFALLMALFTYYMYAISKKQNLEKKIDEENKQLREYAHFMDYHPEHSDLLIGEAERDESGDWVSYAEDDTHIYLLHNTGDGNIVLDYFAAK